jgi:lysyl-tRNA synthetase, class II
MKITYQGAEIDLTPPWRRVSMNDLVREATGVDFYAYMQRGDLTGAKAAAALHIPSLPLPPSQAGAAGAAGATEGVSDSINTVGELLNAAFEHCCEGNLVQPTFVTEHPLDISPLAKPHRDPSKAGLVERFELFVVGREHANGFSELTDPIDQRERFVKQVHRNFVEVSFSMVGFVSLF